jgi:SAM-dependent methyltransferase
MNLELRKVDQSKYPELEDFTKEAIWWNIGPGGLYLVSLLAREIDLQPGAWVLDLGCGYAESSIYLADGFGVKIVAADLWQDPAENARRIEHRGLWGDIIPMRLDASEPLPFAGASARFLPESGGWTGIL